MIVTIHPSKLSGKIWAPASKSSMQRACAAALLSAGETTIINPGHSNDDLAARQLIRGLGAELQSMPDGSLHVSSKGVHPAVTQVNCGESGLGIRMFAPIVSLSEAAISIHGSGSLLNRPMDFFDAIFPRLGITVSTNGGRLPLQVKGPLHPANIEIDGSLSSQFLTGLLMAYSAAGASNVSIRVRNLKSRPYIDLTLKVMNEFGLRVPINRNYEEFYFPQINPLEKPKTGKPVTYTVEGDWSGAAFLLVAGAIAGPVAVKGLDTNSTQGDKAVIQALMSAGAGVSVERDSIEIRPARLRAFQFNATDCPDLFPPLVALAAYCQGTTVLEGVTRLTHKESDRAHTLQEEFGKLGVSIDLQDDLMVVHGGGGTKGGNTHSRHDHRIAMACAVAALAASADTTVEDAEAVDKSYPDFYEDLQRLGAQLEMFQFSS